MKERPILFSAEMVKAILAGRKTQTRRVIKPQPKDTIIGDDGQWLPGDGHSGNGWYLAHNEYPEDGSIFYNCPYGKPGDRLWVRETWTISQKKPDGYVITYREDWDNGPPLRSNIFVEKSSMNDKQIEQAERFFKKTMAWHPSIHMPRWASRINLEITAIRVQRVQDINKVDCEAEGIKKFAGYYKLYFNNGIKGETDSPILSFQSLWDSINAARDFSWDSNPWVWVIEFKQIHPPGLKWPYTKSKYRDGA